MPIFGHKKNAVFMVFFFDEISFPGKRSTFAYTMPYIFRKLWHLAMIWAIRKAFQCILQGVRILLAKYTRISPTSENESYILLGKVTTLLEFQSVFRMGGEFASW